jgi:hypothetical protein
VSMNECANKMPRTELANLRSGFFQVVRDPKNINVRDMTGTSTEVVEQPLKSRGILLDYLVDGADGVFDKPLP